MYDVKLEQLKEAWKYMEKEVLTELRDAGGSGNYVLMYKGKVWRFGDEVDINLLKDFIEEAGLDIEVDENFWFIDLQEYLEGKNRYDILVAKIDGSTLVIYKTGDFYFDPKSSVAVKKLAKHVGAESVKINEFGDEHRKIASSDLKGNIPDRAYHGTSSDYLEKILRIGLRPRKQTRGRGNHDKRGIKHFDHVFFTTRKGEASGHASMTASNTHGLPVIIEFNIPDKELIVPDYDVENMTVDGSGTFAHVNAPSHSKKVSIKADALSQSVGVYGYRGSIPPKYITRIYVARSPEVYDISEYEEFSIEEDGKKALGQAFEIITNETGEENPYANYVYENLGEIVGELEARLDELEDEDMDKEEAAYEIADELESYYGVPSHIIVRSWQERENNG